MYVPELFQNENEDEIINLIRQNSFGILVNETNGEFWATHIPLEIEKNENGQYFLAGHLSKENPQSQSFAKNSKVLAIFSGPHGYISSSWYEKENVPTWNYTAVHVYGNVRIISGEAVFQSLKKLTDRYEKTSENPVRLEALSAKTMRQISGIVAFEIDVERFEAVKKLSQNRNDKDYKQIIWELNRSNDPQSQQVAQAMKDNRP